MLTMKRKPMPNPDAWMPYYTGTWKARYWGRLRNQSLPAASMPGISKFFKKQKVARILAFACGTGRNVVYLAKTGFDVYGFDRSPKAIEATRSLLRKMDKRLATRVRVWNMQKKLPYGNGFFDAVIVIRALYHARVRDIKSMASDVARVTKPGGYIYIESDQRRHIVVFDWPTIKVGKRTYFHTAGPYKGVYYHFFTKRELSSLFKGTKVLQLSFKNGKFHMLVQKHQRIIPKNHKHNIIV